MDLINLSEAQSFKVRALVESLDGKTLSDHTNQVLAAADNRTPVTRLDLDKLAGGHTIFIELSVTDAAGAPVSDNFYWWAADDASFRELNSLPRATLSSLASVSTAAAGEQAVAVKIKNTGSAAAVLIKLTLEDAASGRRILPAYYSDNYFSLLPGDEQTVTVAFPAGDAKPMIGLRGWNIATQTINVQ